MAAQTLGFRTAEFLVSEANGYLSRDEVSVTAVSALPAGQLLGKVTVGAATAAVQAGNTGNATISAVTVGTKTQPGVYVVEFTAATAFMVIAPNGHVIGNGVTGTAFAVTDHIDFTITAGGTPMVAGDGFNVTVAAGSGAYVAYSASATNGAANVAGILFEGVPASTTDNRTIINSDAEVNLAHVTYTGTKAVVVAGLAALGIKVREE